MSPDEFQPGLREGGRLLTAQGHFAPDQIYSLQTYSLGTRIQGIWARDYDKRS
jgi:hypothetical protein